MPSPDFSSRVYPPVSARRAETNRSMPSRRLSVERRSNLSQSAASCAASSLSARPSSPSEPKARFANVERYLEVRWRKWSIEMIFGAGSVTTTFFASLSTTGASAAERS